MFFVLIHARAVLQTVDKAESYTKLFTGRHSTPRKEDYEKCSLERFTSCVKAISAVNN